MDLENFMEKELSQGRLSAHHGFSHLHVEMSERLLCLEEILSFYDSSELDLHYSIIQITTTTTISTRTRISRLMCS